jgi:cytochrome b561
MTRYSRMMIVLHWTMAILILAAWITGEGGRHVRENPPVLHFWLGLSVLVLLLPRLLARGLGGVPSVEVAAATQGQPGVIADLHETGGTLILWLAGLHALIAVWHHFVLRDGTLSRMSPV